MPRFPAVILALALGAAAFPAVTVQNLESGETLRYPVALLKGTAGGATLKVVDRDNSRPDGTNEVKTFEGRFVIVVELKPGRNRLHLTSGDDSKDLAITYKPMTTPYTVNVVYVTARDGDTHYPTPYADDDFDYKARLDTAVKLMQTFTAEQMKLNGYGRKTFNLAFDASGKVKIQTVAYPSEAAELRKLDGNALYGLLYGWLDKQFPMATTKNLTMMGFSGYDTEKKRALAVTALGGGGMALFGGATIYTWPRNLREVEKVYSDDTKIDPSKSCDDSAYRGTVWGVAATTMGAWLHELGHTFGLPHINDGLDIMSRGFDRFNRMFSSYEPVSGVNGSIVKFGDDDRAHWSPYHAAQLSVNRWFQPDAKLFSDRQPPKLTQSDGKVLVTAPNGLALVCYQTGDPTDKRQFEFPASGLSAASYDVETLRSQLGVTGAFRVMAFDKQGNVASIEVK